jgi:hypothetical protein
MARVDLALLIQDLQREGRRGQRQRKPDKQRLAKPEAERQADGGKHERCRHELGGAEPEDRRAHGPKSHRAKLEPDHEQQHDDAELAEMQDALDTVELIERPENIRADDHAGGEIAEHGAHAKNAAERRGNGSGGEKHRHLDQLRRNHRFSQVQTFRRLPYHALQATPRFERAYPALSFRRNPESGTNGSCRSTQAPHPPSTKRSPSGRGSAFCPSAARPARSR